MERIWRAVKGNENLHNAMRDSIANFLKQKENYEYAKEILYSYISQVTAADLNEAYDQLQELSQETKNAIDTALKNFLKSNRNLAIEVAEYYAQTATEDEMRTIYNDLKANEPAATKIKELMDQYFAHYLAYKGLVCTNTTNGNPPTLCDVVTAMSQSGSSTPAPVAYDFSTVNVGDVIHVNDVITITETAAYETGGFSLVYWQSPFTLVRANVTLPAQPGLGEATVVESADGAYYIFKDKDGNYYGLYTDNLNACKATATSDGLVITQKTQVPPSNMPYTEYTIRFVTHEP
jgi:hypothetical protein